MTLSMLERAIEINGVQKGVIQTSLFDVKALNTALPRCNLLLVADLLYEPATAVAVAKRVVEAISKYDAKVIIGDSPNPPRPPYADLHSARASSQYPCGVCYRARSKRCGSSSRSHL